MQVLTPGHKYELASLEGTNPQVLQFIEKQSVGPDGASVTTNDGTTNEEVIEMLINRLNYLQTEHQGGKFKCKANSCAITHLEEALHWLNARTFDRLKRGVEGKHII